MWKSIKRWLRGLWRHVSPPLQALLLYFYEIAIGLIVYFAFRLGAALIPHISDLLKAPTASGICAFVERFIAVTGAVAAIAIVFLSTVKFLNTAIDIFIGINFINMFKTRLGLTGSQGGPGTPPLPSSPPTPPAGPSPPKPKSPATTQQPDQPTGSTRGKAPIKPLVKPTTQATRKSPPKPAPTQPGTQTASSSHAGQSGQQGSKSKQQSDDQAKRQSEDQPKNTPNKSSGRPD